MPKVVHDFLSSERDFDRKHSHQLPYPKARIGLIAIANCNQGVASPWGAGGGIIAEIVDNDVIIDNCVVEKHLAMGWRVSFDVRMKGNVRKARLEELQERKVEGLRKVLFLRPETESILDSL